MVMMVAVFAARARELPGQGGARRRDPGQRPETQSSGTGFHLKKDTGLLSPSRTQGPES